MQQSEVRHWLTGENRKYPPISDFPEKRPAESLKAGQHGCRITELKAEFGCKCLRQRWISGFCSVFLLASRMCSPYWCLRSKQTGCCDIGWKLYNKLLSRQKKKGGWRKTVSQLAVAWRNFISLSEIFLNQLRFHHHPLKVIFQKRSES